MRASPCHDPLGAATWHGPRAACSSRTKNHSSIGLLKGSFNFSIGLGDTTFPPLGASASEAHSAVLTMELHGALLAEHGSER